MGTWSLSGKEREKTEKKASKATRRRTQEGNGKTEKNRARSRKGN